MYGWRTRLVFCCYPLTVSEPFLLHMNIRINLPMKDHNLCPKECQRIVERPGLQTLHRYCLQKSQAYPASGYLYGLSSNLIPEEVEISKILYVYEKKVLGSRWKNRVGRVTVNTHIFGLIYNALYICLHYSHANLHMYNVRRVYMLLSTVQIQVQYTTNDARCHIVSCTVSLTYNVQQCTPFYLAC
jgi:hypothetical protein